MLLGAGMLLLDPLKLAPFESLLPNGTIQLGPPTCIHTNKDSMKILNLKKIFHFLNLTHKNSGFFSSKSHYISTRNCLRALFLKCRLNLIDHFKSTCRIPVGIRSLLTQHASGAVKKYRCITALQRKDT